MRALAFLAGLTVAAASARAGDMAVAIDNFAFAPATLSVPVGTTVTWTNRDDIPHTVTDAGGGKSFHSPPLDSGEHFTWTFDHPGTYRYFCSIHAHMQGTIVVQ